MESEGRMSRAARQSGAKVAAAITAARNRAVNRGEDPDEAEKGIRQKLSNKKVPNTDGDTTTPKEVQIIMKRASPVQLARSAKLNATLKRKLEQLEHKESKRNKLLTQGLDLHDPKIYALDDEIKGSRSLLTNAMKNLTTSMLKIASQLVTTLGLLQQIARRGLLQSFPDLLPGLGLQVLMGDLK